MMSHGRAPTAHVILVGDELISGHRRDEIGPRLAGRLESQGFEIRELTMLPDRKERISSSVAGAVDGAADVVILSGGLGPTSDDKTRQGVAEALHVPLVVDEAAERRIEERYEERGRDVPAAARQQALIPSGGEPISNKLGTAPGFVVRTRRSVLFALPGVPREFEAMFDRSIAPLLESMRSESSTVVTRVLRVAGLTEPDVARRVEERASLPEGVSVKFLARPGEIELLVGTRADDHAAAVELVDDGVAAIRAELGDFVYGSGDSSLVGVLSERLSAREWTLATAESCTGGLLGKTITDLAGSSAFYLGGVTVYHDTEKMNLLGVRPELLERYGAVSPRVARAMAIGCKERLRASLALSVTGIAGPGGGSSDKPVGLVYLGLATGEGVNVSRHTFVGDRAHVRQCAATAALDEARRWLDRLSPLGEPIAPEED